VLAKITLLHPIGFNLLKNVCAAKQQN